MKWGPNDCCSFLAQGIKAITGKEIRPRQMRSYKSQLGGRRVLKKYGGVETIVAREFKRCGFPEVPLTMVKRGGAVLYDSPTEGPAAGMCLGRLCAFVGTNGLDFISLDKCRRAWNIGD